MITRVDEKYLQSTGKKANPKDFQPVDTVRVQVDSKTGKGRIIDK